MSTVRPFRFVRPRPDLASQLASLPYDVMNRAEAKAMAAGNPFSFLHICRSEIDLPDSVDAYAPAVYAQARQTLDRFQAEGTLIQDPVAGFCIYRQVMWGRVQTGIVGGVSVDEYQNGTIKRHELTRKDKELDRINHFDVCDANTEPIFLAYRRHAGLSKLINEWIKFHKPAYDFKTPDGITHILWPVDDPAVVKEISDSFATVPNLYIADGHHRTASGAEVCLRRRAAKPGYKGDEEFNFVMAVVFPDDDLFIMDYNRLVKDLNGLSEAEFLAQLGKVFDVKPHAGPGSFRPMQKHAFGMFLGGRWHACQAKPGTWNPADPIGSLDCAILQDNVLDPILGIKDPRTDKRIDFVGGIRGLEELERRCQNGMAVAFALCPVTMEDLFAVADADKIMPPKSTWFEPKLASGLFVHKLS